MSFPARKLEVMLRDINQTLEEEGLLRERLIYDVWTKLMSSLLQGEYTLSFPIRQELHQQVRKRRPDKIVTFNAAIQKLDHMLDTYIPPPLLSTSPDHMKIDKPPAVIKDQRTIDTRAPYIKEDIRRNSISPIAEENLERTIVDAPVRERHIWEAPVGKPTVGQKQRPEQTEEHARPVISGDEPKKDDVTRERYNVLRANESVLMKTVEDQQRKIRKLEETVQHLEKKNIHLKEEIQDIGEIKDDNIDVFKKAEKEMKYLRNEMQIKEKLLELSLIERNELLDRLSDLSSSKFAREKSSALELDAVLRPSQIADKYSQLYETDWMDAFHLLTLEMTEQRTAIKWLLEILQDSYSFCRETSEAHSQVLYEELMHPGKRGHGSKHGRQYHTGDTINRMIDELKKVAAKETISKIQVLFLNAMERSKKPYYDDKHMKRLSGYMDRCVELCWQMVTQVPPLCLDEQRPDPGDPLDRDAYRCYSQTGSKFDFLVWPALYLASQKGFLLAQGVVQPKPEGIALLIPSSKTGSRRPSTTLSHLDI